MAAPAVPYVSPRGKAGPGWLALENTLRSLQVYLDGTTLTARLRDGRTVRASATGSRDVARLLNETWTNDTSRLIVFADKPARRAALGALGREALIGTRRQLDLVLSWAASTRAVVLTDALPKAWWEPTGGYGDYEAWSGHFGLDPADQIETVNVLLWCARAGEANIWQQGKVEKIVELEVASMDVRNHRRSPGGDAAAYLMGGGLSTLWMHYFDLDPQRVIEGVYHGTVTAVNGLRVAGAGVTGALSEASKLKSGKSVFVFDSSTGQRLGDARVESLGFTARDGVTATFGSSNRGFTPAGQPSSSKGFTKMMNAARERDTELTFYVAEDGYISGSRRQVWSTWTQTVLPEGSRQVRDVPLDVILAGG